MLASRKTFLHFLSLLPALSSAWKDFDKYVPYPPEIAGALNDTISLAADVPPVRVLATLPGDHFFDELQGVAVRNSNQNPLFKMDLMYVMGDGYDMDCRKKRENETTNEFGRVINHGRHRRESPDCLSHCTHQGRYCPAFPQAELAKRTDHNGRDLVLEVLRRLCMGEVLEHGFADPVWFEYLRNFEKHDCLGSKSDLAECSWNIIENDLSDFPSVDGSGFIECLMEEESDSDVKNPILERSLDLSHVLKYKIEEMPVMEISGEKYEPTGNQTISAEHVLTEWCSNFKGDIRPVACDFCADCADVETCLWSLDCDGEQLGMETYQQHKEAMTERLEEDAEEVVIDTFDFIMVATMIGFAFMGVCWFVMREKRRRAYREVAKEMPDNGFSDLQFEVEEKELPELS